MKKIILISLILILISFFNLSRAQDEEVKNAFQKFIVLYNSGDFVSAQNCLTLLLEKKKLTKGYLVAAYNNLGATNSQLGDYSNALKYYSEAEALLNFEDQYLLDLADIYINKAIIYGTQKSYTSSIAYFEKGIRIYLDITKQNKGIYYRISTAYLNAGIIYYEIADYSTALNYLMRSAEIKEKNNISESAFVYLNIAKTLFKLNELEKSNFFFQKSIKSAKLEFGENYFRSAEIYFGYGLFLRAQDKNEETLLTHRKALTICLKNYGSKHTLVSLSYKHLADDYRHISKIDSALYYYQKSLIAVVKDFNNPDIYSNPSIDSSLFDIRLLDNLKSKAQVLELLAGSQTDPEKKLKSLGSSLGTIDLALSLIDRIRNNYMSEESRIYLAENEKETYVFATQIAYKMFLMTHDDKLGYKMYSIAQKAKAAILRNEITGNELLYSGGIPDSLREKQTNLSTEIAAYNNLIIEENRKLLPDSAKISRWKDALFDMNRGREKVTDNIEKVFPQYHDLIRKTEPLALNDIRKRLKNDETIIDYLISNQYTDGKRKLYIFLISKNGIDFREENLDSLFIRNAEIIRKTSNPSNGIGSENISFADYTTALNYMYLNLVAPVENILKGKKLIIIPDEEIGWLPFDAFLKNKPSPEQTDYEGLSYLINDYTFSYGYSSSLIFNKSDRLITNSKVFAFSPEYDNLSSKLLRGTGTEIGSIYKDFTGTDFSGKNSTKANFLMALDNRAILHLAMHSMSDSINPKYSYLLFNNNNTNVQEGRLYNYEVSLTRIKSPMVVLSSCNSGTGTLYFGEGLMSLARGFTLAGASSVVITSWEINDESSATIMTHFYDYLSKGREKNDAMRLAKLAYLENSPPAFKNPYFWAGYQVLGDNSPVSSHISRLEVCVILVILIIGGGIFFYYRRRKIFSARSL